MNTSLAHESIKPYASSSERSEQVRDMFDNIAPDYDRMNHSMAWSIDRWWRRRALRYLTARPSRMLDIATGTGDLAIDACRQWQPDAVDATDISEGMMAIGRQKVEALGLSRIIRFSQDDCMALSAQDNTYDAVISAYGLRNFPSLTKSFSEMLRVLSPGGEICLVELAVPPYFPVRQLFWVYTHTIMPLLSRLMSKDVKAYRYLVHSIEAFPQAERVDEMLREAGFCHVQHHRFTFGICTCFIAQKPKK